MCSVNSSKSFLFSLNHNGFSLSLSLSLFPSVNIVFSFFLPNILNWLVSKIKLFIVKLIDIIHNSIFTIVCFNSDVFLILKVAYKLSESIRIFCAFSVNLHKIFVINICRMIHCNTLLLNFIIK